MSISQDITITYAQCGWVSNTFANNIGGKIARCGCPYRRYDIMI